jgi:membrane-bound ClpP family serine protease
MRRVLPFLFLLLCGLNFQLLAQGFSDHIKYNTNAPNTIGYIRVDNREGEINQSTWLYIKSAVDHYKALDPKPSFIIMELNTPGGEVFAAMKISDALKALDTEDNIPVVTFINNWAISAGAMLAFSTRYITTVKDGVMGAAEPVTVKDGEMHSASEKVNSAFRTDFANRAEFFHRNALIAEKMVDKSPILVMRNGVISHLNTEAEILPTDTVISGKDKLLTLNAEQMLKYKVADMILEPFKLEPLTTKEKIEGVYPASKSLLFHQPFFENIPNATIREFQPDWKTRFFMVLAHPLVASLLFFGLMMGFYIEINTPGFGVAGSIAAICLTLIVFSSFAQEIGGFLEVILMLVGALILIVDFVFLPTFGILGAFGTLLFIVGLFALMLPGLGSFNYEVDTHTLNAAGEILIDRLTWFLGTFLAAIVAMIFLGRYITPRIPFLRRFVLVGDEQMTNEGYTAGIDPATIPPIGTVGEVVSTLRPSGKAIFNDKLFDVISQGSFIEKGTKVIVIRTENGNIVVIEQEET